MPRGIRLTQVTNENPTLEEFRERIAGEIRALGARPGDALLVRTELRAISFPRNLKRHIRQMNQILLDALFDVVGLDGTIFVPTFTSAGMTFVKKLPRFSQNTPTSAGSFPNFVLSHPESFRSTHPINSWAAIGKNAEYLTKFHTENSSCFTPMEIFTSLGGKQLVIGCLYTSPGVGTLHAVQHNLGYSTKSLLSGLGKAKYISRDGKERVFRKWDIPGCSSGFDKMYPIYRQAGVAVEGTVLGLESMLISARDSYRIEEETLSKDPQFLRCDNPACLDCNFFSYYARGHRLRFLRLEAPKLLMRRLRRVLKSR